MADFSICLCAGAIEELVGLEQEWKRAHLEKLQRMTGLLERYGVIPIGSVDVI